MPRFDVDAAVADGKTIPEIASFLSETHQFDYNKARYDGISDEEIVGFLKDREVAPEPESTTDKAGAVGDIVKFGLNLPTRIKGAIGNVMTNDQEIGTDTTWERWAREDEELTKQRKAEQGSGASKRVFEDIPITRGDIADAESSSGFSVVAGGPSAVAEGIRIASNAIPNPAGKLAAQVGSVGLGMAGSFDVARRADKNMFTRQLLDKANADLIEARGEGMNQSERSQFLLATEDLRNQHGLWEAGPEAIGNAIGMFGIGKIIAGAAGGKIGKALTGYVLNQLGEHSTETITGTGQQRVEVEAGMQEGPKREWNVEGLTESFKEQAPVTTVLGTVMGGGAASVGGGYRAAKGMVTGPGVEDNIQVKNPSPYDPAQDEAMQGIRVPDVNIPPVTDADFAGRPEFEMPKGPLSRAAATVAPVVPGQQVAPPVSDTRVLSQEAPPVATDQSPLDVRFLSAEEAEALSDHSDPVNGEQWATMPDGSRTAFRVFDEEGMDWGPWKTRRMIGDDVAPQVTQQVTTPVTEAPAGESPAAAPQADMEKVAATFQAIREADSETLEGMAKIMPQFLKDNPEYKQFEQQFRQEFHGRRQKLASQAQEEQNVNPTANQPAAEPAQDDALYEQAKQYQTEIGTVPTIGELVQQFDIDVDAASALHERLKENNTPAASDASAPSGVTLYRSPSLFGQSSTPATRDADTGAFLRDQKIRSGAVGRINQPVRRVPGESPDAYMKRRREELEQRKAFSGKAPAMIDIKAHEAALSPKNDLQEPTDGQKEAGNYRKGHVRLHGLDISIENPAGSTRSGVDPDGKRWETPMRDHYGYIKGTVGKDKDHIDLFIPEGFTPAEDDMVAVVDQVDPKTGKFDEHKVVLGAIDEATARETYLRNYDKTGKDRIGAVTMIPVKAFRGWLASGETKKPLGKITVSQSAESDTQTDLPVTGETQIGEQSVKEEHLNQAGRPFRTIDLANEYIAKNGLNRDEYKVSPTTRTDPRTGNYVSGYVVVKKADQPSVETVTPPSKGEASNFYRSPSLFGQSSTPATREADTTGFLQDQKGRKEYAGRVREPLRKEPGETVDQFMARRREVMRQRKEWTSKTGAMTMQPAPLPVDEAAQLKKEKAAYTERTNAAFAWLQNNENVLALAELKDKQGYIDIADSELAAWLADAKKQADKSGDKILSAAIDLMLADGKTTMPKAFFDKSYKAALAKVKAEAEERAVRRSAQHLEEKIGEKGLSGDAADNFREGWNHAIAGKTRSSLRMNDQITEGYDAARAFLQTDQGKALRKKDQKRKLEGTGAELTRIMDKKRSEIKASDSTEAIVKKIMAATNRADLFKGITSDEATPGAQKLLSELRGYFYTFSDFLTTGRRPLRQTYGEYLGRASAEDKMKAYLDLRVHRYDEGAQKTLEDETREERVELLKRYAEDYTNTIIGITENIRGDNVKDLAISITNGTTDDGLHKDRSPSYSVTDAATHTSKTMKVNVAGAISDQYSFMRQLLAWVDKDGEIYRTGRTVETLLAKENDDSLKRKSGPPLTPPKLDRVTRKGGKDYRKGRNVTTEEFKQTFGFTDVGFGDYVLAGQDQDHLNYSYDAFMELADLLGLPPKAMSIAGRLYFSIGNLGHGKASAHYNQGHPHPKFGTVPVINVTNTRGDGTVSHEWAHAFDLTTRNMAQAFSRVRGALMNSMNWAAIERDVRMMLKGDMFWKGASARTATKQERIDNALQLFDYYRRKQTRTQFFRDALDLDGVKTSTANPYWSNEKEILARSFEAWVSDKLESLGRTNTYLVNPEWVGDGKITKEKGFRGTPYPTGEERKLFNRYFDAMVDSLVYDEKSGEVTVDMDKFQEKAPNPAAENRAKWEELSKTFPQLADEIERDEMARKREARERIETTKAMKVGDIIEPRENVEAVGERLKVTFPATVVWAEESENYYRKIKVLDSIGAEIQVYAYEMRIVTPAEDITTTADLADLPAEATAADSGKLSDADLESIFNDALNEVQESTQEQPEAPTPGTDIASDLKTGDWTREDIQEIRGLVAEGKIIMVGDKSLGIPTIHDFPSDNTKHHGFGAFTATTPEYTADFDGGGMMRKTVGGRAYTVVYVKEGTIPFYNQQAVLDTIDTLLGVKKPQTGEVAAAKVQRDFDALMAGKDVEGYSVREVSRSAKQGGKTWIYEKGNSKHYPADGVVQDKETAAARALYELDYLVDEINTVVNRFRQQQQTTKAPPPSLKNEQDKTVKNLAAEAAKLGVEGIDEALTGLVKLFGGGKSTLMSFPAGFNEETYQQAKPHFSAALKKFQEAGKSLKDLFVYLIQNFGAGIKPYALRFAKDEELTRGLGEKTSASKKVATFVADRLTHGQAITWQELFAKADEAWGGTQAENVYTSRDAYDAMEMGVNLWIRNQNSLSTTVSVERAEKTAERLAKAINLLPTQTKRTQEQIQFQQFSTPPALAYVANWVSKVGPHDVMMEPSAGTGDLAIWSEKAGAKLILNELSSRRAGLLRELFPNASILTEDGLQLNNILPQSVQASVVVMNPPFSSTAGRTNTNDTMNGAKHLEQALKRLAPGGRLVAIVGEGMGASKPSFQKWWKDIKSKYNVRANISINGAEYAKYGTTFDNQIIVIDNTGKTTEDPITVRVDSVAALPKILEAIRNDRQDATALSPSQRTDREDTQGGKDTLGQNETGMDGNNRPDDVDTGGRGEEGATSNDGEGGGLSGTVRGPRGGGSGSGSTRSEGSSGSGRGSRGGRGSGSGASGRTEPGGRGGKAPGGTQLGDGTAPGEISVDAVTVEREGELTDSIFEPYKPQRLSIPGAKEHPGPLVQSAAMASVEPPAPTYTPNLPKDVIANGLLSLAQLEAVVYAGQAHSEVLPDGKRRGFFIGDNTGVGKGREISGIILDNIRQGRKRAVWVSKAAGLLNDARRDFGGIGGDPKLIFPKPNSPNAPITQKEGVLFITYDTLKQAATQRGSNNNRSRLDQVLEWLGEDFDGVIAFDEAHAMGNATAIPGVRGASRPSQTALTGVKIQDKATNARIVYVSATGATEVKNLSYATRLGLWGANTPFANPVGFINSIVTGGVAAMEMVARDMKALGSYIARSLSFDGIEYRTLRADLSALNVKKYDELARMWQIVLQNINQALADTGGDKAAGVKKNAMGAFWGAQQRFFNQVLTAMQTPAMIEDAKKQLEAGKSVVVQLTNHYGDQAEREAAKAREDGIDLEEMDLTPRQMLEQFLRNAFPTQEYEEQTDDAGNTIMVAVLDSEGRPVHNADAVAARDRLLETLQQISIPGNPIDTILQELGKENVAEITGRKKRYLSVRDGKGGYKVVEEKRGNSASQKEAAEFQEGKRRALIFSGAGATGFSFHADRTAKNQQQRIHYVLQPGWRADTAVQGFGRTHRTNQASTPEYVLVTTDVQAQKRFVSSIARRLDQLGALTKGQRETSGGLFNASDNLESKYGHAALVALFTNMANGYTTMDFDEVTREMGLTNLRGDQGQFLPNNIPEMTKFLNRLLSLTIDRQNEVFGTFFQYLDEIVNRAMEQGTYDSGLQTIKAQSIKKVRDEVVFSDERTGAQSRFVEVDISNPVRFRDFDAAQRWAKSRGDKFAGWFKGPRTKIFGLVDLGERLDKDGRPFRRGEVIGIIDGSKRHVDNVLAITREINGYEKIKDAEAAEAAWEKAIDEAPVTSTERKHMLVGVLMPIWDRIAGNPTIFRMQTDAGEVLLGRTLAGKDLQQTMRNLGVGNNLEGMGAQQFLDQIKGGATAILANGWQITQKRVSGDNRIELTKPRGASFNDSEIGILTSKGAFHEVISWTDRVFIPQGKESVAVFESITRANPVVEIEGGGQQQEEARLSQTTSDSPGSTVAQGKAEIAGQYNPDRVTIVQIESKLPKGAKVTVGTTGRVQGAYLPGQDRTFLVADNISTGEWSRVLHHEGFHRAMASGSFSDVFSELERMEKMYTGSGQMAKWFEKAREKAQVDRGKPHYIEEIGAYAVSQYAESPKVIQRWVDRLVAKLRMFLRQIGVKVNLTPAMLREIAARGLRAKSVEQSGFSGQLAPAFSKPSPQFKPVDVLSENFKRWFKGSKVVDENGKPLVVYHGSPDSKIIEHFYVTGRGNWFGDGAYFSSNQDQASKYAMHGDGKIDDPRFADSPGVVPVFLALKNPAILSDGDITRRDALAVKKALTKHNSEQMGEEFYAWYKRRDRTWWDVWNFLESKEFNGASWRGAWAKDVLENAGFDGIIANPGDNNFDSIAHGAIHYVAFSPTQIKSAISNTGEFSKNNPNIRYSVSQPDPVSLENLESVATDMAKAAKKGSITFVKNAKKDSTFIERLLSTPEYYFKKTSEAAGRVLQAALLRRDVRFQKQKEILGDFVSFVQDLRKTDMPAYQEANEYLIDTDQVGGFSIKETEDGWAVMSRDGKKEMSTHPTDKEAQVALVEAEANDLKSQGYSDKAVEAVKMARALTNRAFDVMAEDMRRIIQEAADNGRPNPFIGDGKIDEAGRYGVYAKGKKMPLALFRTEQEAKERLAKIAELVSYSVVSAKGDVKYFSSALKAKKWAARRGGNFEMTKRFANLSVKKRTDAEMRPMTVKEALAQMGDLRGSYFPRIRENGEYVLIARKDGENQFRQNFDLPGVGDGNRLQAILNSVTPIGRKAKELKAQGYDVTISKDTKPTDDVFDATNLITSLDAILQESMGELNKNDSDEVKAAQVVDQIITMQIADIFKARGYLASRMKRLSGEETWEGYETDMGKALTQYGKNIAAGTAKRDTARAMVLAFSGRDYTWKQYKDEVENPTWEEYKKIVEDRRIDPGKQKNLFKDVRGFIVDVLRNDEQTDRIVGTLKGLAVHKFLGFRISSAAVNATNMVTGVVGTMSGKTGESLNRSLRRVMAAATAYTKYRSGVGSISDEDRAIFLEITARGWDEAQFDHEAMSELRSKMGDVWNKYEAASMFMFGAVEKANRAMTIFAALKAVRAKHPTMDEKLQWDMAKEISDTSHGTYGKETLPAMARGGDLNRMLRMPLTFTKFTHNYMLNMIDLGFNKRQWKAASYLLLSPALIAGSGATLAAPLVFALAGALGIGGDDPEEEFYKWSANTFGTDAFARHGLAGLAGVNIKGSLAINMPMPADVSKLKLVDIFGPVGGVVGDVAKGAASLAQGDVAKGVELLLPTAFGSMSKAFREHREGVTTSNYGSIFYGDEPLKADELDAALRFLSFNPSRISGIREKQWNEKEVAAKYQERKTAIYHDIKRDHLHGRGLTPEILKEIKRYNELVDGSGRSDISKITPKSIRTMLKRNAKPQKRELERASAMR